MTYLNYSEPFASNNKLYAYLRYYTPSISAPVTFYAIANFNNSALLVILLARRALD